jgi:hypothetical protein
MRHATSADREDDNDPLGNRSGSRRDGFARLDNKRTHRIYNELGLQLRTKAPKRRVKAKLREDRRDATAANETWAMDFVHDARKLQPGVIQRTGSAQMMAGFQFRLDEKRGSRQPALCFP